MWPMSSRSAWRARRAEHWRVGSNVVEEAGSVGSLCSRSWRGDELCASGSEAISRPEVDGGARLFVRGRSPPRGIASAHFSLQARALHSVPRT